MRRKNLLALAMLLCLCPIAGCGSSVVKPTEEQNVFASVEGLGDIAADEQMFANAFVPGAVPDDREQYGVRGYQVNGEASYDGDQVSVPVKIFGGVHSTSSSDSRRSRASTVAETEQIWTLQRVDGVWKIKNAPLG